MFKPKFAPKAPPVKKDPVPAASSTPASTSESNGTKVEGNDRRKNAGGRGAGRGGRGAGRGGGRGRGGRFVAPIGTAFFSGTSVYGSSTSSAPTPSFTIGSSSATTVAKRETPMVIAARPNEVVDMEVRGADDSMDLVSTPTEYYSDDSDASDHENAPTFVDPNSGERYEVWPPTQNYDPLNPLSLPYGPKTQKLRRYLASQSLLAAPEDTVGRYEEETSALFLVQMPSDLSYEALQQRRQIHNLAVSRVGEASAAQEIEADIKENGLEKVPHVGDDGRLGRLQLLKSGRVRLVTKDGLRYELSPGMAVSFMQTFASIAVADKEDTGKPKLNITPEGNSTTKVGEMRVLGVATKKAVLTPEYELGTTRDRTTIASSVALVSGAPESAAEMSELIDVSVYDSTTGVPMDI